MKVKVFESVKCECRQEIVSLHDCKSCHLHSKVVNGEVVCNFDSSLYGAVEVTEFKTSQLKYRKVKSDLLKCDGCVFYVNLRCSRPSIFTCFSGEKWIAEKN